MSCIINSTQSLVLATAMVVSTTTALLYLTFTKQPKDNPKEPSAQTLRSCLYSREKKMERESENKNKKKKKRVHFAESVKETKGNGEEYRKEYDKKFVKKVDGICRNGDDHHHNNNIHGMPANRVALYNGILRDRVHRMQCSY